MTETRNECRMSPRFHCNHSCQTHLWRVRMDWIYSCIRQRQNRSVYMQMQAFRTFFIYKWQRATSATNMSYSTSNITADTAIHLQSYATLQTTEFLLVLQATLASHCINYYHQSLQATETTNCALTGTIVHYPNTLRAWVMLILCTYYYILTCIDFNF